MENLAVPTMCLLFGLIFGYWTINAVSKGQIPGKRGVVYTKVDSPGVYWFGLIVLAASTTGFIGYAFMSLM